MKQSEGAETVQTLADLLPVAAARFGDRTAVIGDDQRISFLDADLRAAAVADRLIGVGVALGDHVVVMMHKTSASFVVMHSVLRAGAVIVPLDPLMPVPAATELIASVRPSALIVDAASMQRLGVENDTPVDASPAVFVTDADDAERAVSLRALLSGDEQSGVDDEQSGVDDEQSGVDDEQSGVDDGGRPVVGLDDPAYVIFTSGSTGEPKGITHTHRSAMAYARLAVETHEITAEDRLAGLPPLHFDMSTLELYSAPLAGAAIIPIGTAELRFPASFTERAENERITIWYSVPFQLRQISDRGALDQRDLSSLRHVIYAGEAFPWSALATLMTQLPGVRFSNAYGPAETNVVTVLDVLEPPTSDVSIGYPWGDVEIAVVDPETEVIDPETPATVPDGELGELWVRAASVMTGYLHRPDITAERLIGTGDRRWYRTGDLVRRGGGGALWLAGRIDHQVKVRGTRLELEAVEAVLAAHPDIADAVVAPDSDRTPVEHLVAAVTLAVGVADLDHRAFRRWCAVRLSAVAVPISVEVRESFPLTSSGKIDRNDVRSDLHRQPDDQAVTPAGVPVVNGSQHV